MRTGPNLCLSIYIYIYQSGLVIVCIYSRFLIIKARPKKYFFPSFPKNKIHLSKHHTHITLILMSDSSPTTLRQIPASFLKIRSLEVRSYRVNRAKNNTYFANQREDIFYLPHLLPPWQDRFKQFPTPRPEGLDLSRGLPGGGVTGQIKQCIIESSGSKREVQLANLRLVHTYEGNERYIFKPSSTKLWGWENVNVPWKIDDIERMAGGYPITRGIHVGETLGWVCGMIWTRCISWLRRPRLYVSLEEHKGRTLRARLNGKARSVCKGWHGERKRYWCSA